MTPTSPPASLEAKLVLVGTQGVGKSSLVHRHTKHTFLTPSLATPTVGASFTISSLTDPESGATIRLQIWDTAGQERFRSISRLYYRGAQAAIVCYDVTNRRSFEDVSGWVRELREVCGEGIIVQVVGTKADLAAEEPGRREVPFERCVNYVADQVVVRVATPSPWGAHGAMVTPPSVGSGPLRSDPLSVYGGVDNVSDCAHEVSAKDGEGVDEVFRVITRKLVEQHNRKLEHLKMLESMQQSRGRTLGVEGVGEGGYFDLPKNGAGSFRLGYGDRRRSWLSGLTPGGLTNYSYDSDVNVDVAKGVKRGRCC